MQRVKKMRSPKIWSPECEGVLQPPHRGQKGRITGVNLDLQDNVQEMVGVSHLRMQPNQRCFQSRCDATDYDFHVSAIHLQAPRRAAFPHHQPLMGFLVD